jgi:hypothetical protein
VFNLNISEPTGRDIAELLLLFAPKESLDYLELSKDTIEEFVGIFDEHNPAEKNNAIALAMYYAHRNRHKVFRNYSLLKKFYISPMIVAEIIETALADGEIKEENLSKLLKSENAKRAANRRHDKPNGSRDKAEKIRAIWATGKYSSRDLCAEQEYAALGYGSFKAARNALKNTPDPIK